MNLATSMASSRMDGPTENKRIHLRNHFEDSKCRFYARADILYRASGADLGVQSTFPHKFVQANVPSNELEAVDQSDLGMQDMVVK